MHEKEHHREWERDWLEGNLSSDEVMEKMGRTDEIVALLRSGAQAAKLRVPEKRSKEEIWSILVDKVDQERETKVIPLHRRYWIAVAASVVLLVGAFFLFKAVDTVTYKTSFGQTASFHLPDNSVVTLNAGSALSYSKRNWKDERSLSMKGEAFFEVQKGSNFTVNTRLGKVEVLGTSFNVRIYNGELVVSCKTGKVRVTDNESEMETITPGERVKAKKLGMVDVPKAIALEQIDAWIDGERELESISFKEITKEIERQFDIDVQLDGLNPSDMDAVLTTWITRDDLGKTLDELTLASGHIYEIKGNDKVIIKSKTQ